MSDKQPLFVAALDLALTRIRRLRDRSGRARRSPEQVLDAMASVYAELIRTGTCG